MLTAVELDNQVPLAANEVDVVSIDGLLADEFEAAELPTAKACPQREFCWREGASQRSRTFSALLILPPQRLEPSAQETRPSPDPLPASGAREAEGRAYNIPRFCSNVSYRSNRSSRFLRSTNIIEHIPIIGDLTSTVAAFARSSAVNSILIAMEL